jgi:hypothetical protein
LDLPIDEQLAVYFCAKYRGRYLFFKATSLAQSQISDERQVF